MAKYQVKTYTRQYPSKRFVVRFFIVALVLMVALTVETLWKLVRL